MKNKFLRWFTAGGRLGSKLMCIYFLLIVLPLGMFSFYAYLRVRNMVQEQTFSAARAAFDDTCLSLERLLGRLDGVIDILSTDPLVYTMASNDPGDYTYIHRLEDSAQLATTFEHLCMLADIDLCKQRLFLFQYHDQYHPHQPGCAQLLVSKRLEERPANVVRPRGFRGMRAGTGSALFFLRTGDL